MDDKNIIVNDIEKNEPTEEKQITMPPQRTAAVSAAVSKEIPGRIREVGRQFEFFGLYSLIFGVVYSFCLFRNPGGITYPLFVAAGYGIAVLMLKRLGISLKQLSWFIMAVSFLLGITSSLTASGLLLNLNRMVLFLLACVFVLHQFYEDRSWNIGKYVSSVLLFLCYAIGCIGYPFQHMAAYFKGVTNKKCRNILMIFAGAAIGIPMMICLALLLSSADLVFKKLLTSLLDTFLNPWTLFTAVLKTISGILLIYLFLCSGCMKNIKEEAEDRRTKEPLVAITGMGMIMAVYLLFSGIQIVYLFLGKGSLPEGVTYSEYARQGFFQLLFVVFLNLVMVLCCIKYFKRSRVLNLVLTVICVCTYVMIASAVYRMLLYVGIYHLTFLRVLVLWFLALLAVLMIGVVLVIYRNTFPLFRFCLVIISVFYLGFVGMKPDQVIAEYNISHMDEVGEDDFHYLFYRLSVDAAPVIANMDKEACELYYNKKIKRYDDKRSLRTMNLSYEKARKLFEGKF